jgi:two-component system chemotaxis sensor kinase CheA
MSDDFIETIWAQYAVETEEHIEGIESLLVRADGGELSAEEISSLFRAFHSLKGLSRVMELGALEAVAHRAEDLLGLVREGVTGLDKGNVDLLLRSLDAIKGLRDIAVAERSDGQKPDALCKELEEAFRKANGGGGAEVSEPAPAASAAPAPAVPAAPAPEASVVAPTASTPSNNAKPAPKPAPKKAAPEPKKLVKVSASGTDEDTPDDMSIFLRLLKNGLPILEQLAVSIATNEDAKHIVAVSNDVRRPLLWMMRASDKLGYLGITRRIKEIADALPKDEAISREVGEKVVDTIVAFLSDLRNLGETTGTDLGGESLSQVLNRTLRESLEHVLKGVLESIEALEAKPNFADETLASQVAQEFSRVEAYLTSLFPDTHCDLPLFVMDAYARAGRSDLKLNEQFLQCAKDAVAFVRDVCQSKDKKPLQNAAIAAKQESLSQQIKDCVWAHDNASNMSAQQIEAFHAELGLQPELAQLLSSENTLELKELLDSGSKAYLVVAHLESSEQIATSFLSWVSEKGRIITNRSVFVQEESWYEMLLVSKSSFEEIDDEIKQLDGDQQLIRLLGQFGVKSGPGKIEYTDETSEQVTPEVAAPAAPASPAPAVVAPEPAVSASSAAVNESPEPAATAASAVPSAEATPVAPSAPVASTSGVTKPAPAADAAKRAPAPAAAAANVIRVPGEMLDQFMNQIGEMVLVRGQLAHVIADQRIREQAVALRRTSDSSSTDPAAVAQFQRLIDLIDEQNRRLQETDALIQGALSRLQDSVMGLRVVPVELVFKRFPRMVRDLAQAQGKQIRLELTGQEVKIDKAMVESLADPLLHMVRNSADHGIETIAERKLTSKPEEAVIRIQAEQQGSRILIRVSDDGKGIDPERVRRKAVERGLVKEEDSLLMSRDEILKFIFRAGFSTADVVTETSGRGVGMDVVRTNVMRLGGNIHLDSELGRGTIFTMQMPLSAAVQEVLLVNTAGQTLAMPGRYVAELVEINESDVQTVKGRTAITLRGNFLPIVRLEELLGFKQISDEPHKFVVVLSDGQRTLGVSVDEFVGRQELFTKDIHPRLAALPGVGGASILGDGRVVLILDGPAIYRLAENIGTKAKLPPMPVAA